MRGKYITKQIWIACLTKPASKKKNIHAQLEETIAERQRIMAQMENKLSAARVIGMYLTSTQAA